MLSGMIEMGLLELTTSSKLALRVRSCLLRFPLQVDDPDEVLYRVRDRASERIDLVLEILSLLPIISESN